MGRIHVCDSFVLLLSLLFLADDQHNLWLFLAAAGLHEGGHYFALRCVGGKLIDLRLSAAGAVMRYRLRDSVPRRVVIAFAGPLANGVTAVMAAHLGAYPFAGANVILGIFNLLPILPLDGGMILYWLLCSFGHAAEQISVSAVILLGLAGVACAYSGHGVMPLMMAGILLTQQKNLQKYIKRDTILAYKKINRSV